MKYIRTLFAILVILLCASIPFTHAATEQRTALVIGNSAYSSSPLKNPVNDATAIASKLKKLGFAVTIRKNAGQKDMDDAIREFGRQLKKKRGVGLFYYAGHGIQIGGVNYLLPVNARIEKESDVKFNAVNADMVLAEMENAENGLNIVILDACRDNPFARSFRNTSRGLAIISNAPSGTFISYSTGANQVARDGDGKNSPYTQALLDNLDKPGLTINKVFMNVRSKLKKETGQVPWELSSLEGDFYFLPRKSITAKETQTVPAITEKEPDQSSMDRNDERSKIEAEKEKLRQEAELIDQKEALAAEKQKLEERKKQLAMGMRPPGSTAKEIKRDGRFIAYDNGTVLDTRSNLMWAAKDNGFDINWSDAKSYCENYRGGGYSDWRMPTQDELTGLYDSSNPKPQPCYPSNKIYLTNLIDLSCCCPWASETRGSYSVLRGYDAAYYNFYNGYRYWNRQSFNNYPRALPVRSAK
jgi:uncharacterized caspase-like protein